MAIEFRKGDPSNYRLMIALLLLQSFFLHVAAIFNVYPAEISALGFYFFVLVLLGTAIKGKEVRSRTRWFTVWLTIYNMCLICWIAAVMSDWIFKVEALPWVPTLAFQTAVTATLGLWRIRQIFRKPEKENSDTTEE